MPNLDKSNLNPDDIWNINAGYLNYINNLIVVYGECTFNDDYYGMYKALKLMEHTLSPKVDKDKVEENLQRIKINLKTMIVRDTNGQIARYQPHMIDQTVDLLDETYRHMMMKMEDAGVLTKQPKDPNKAFGNFRGS